MQIKTKIMPTFGIRKVVGKEKKLRKLIYKIKKNDFSHVLFLHRK